MEWTIRSFLRWVFPVEVKGDVSPCERERRLLVVANYPSAVAGLLLGLVLPRKPLVILPPGTIKWQAVVLGRFVECLALDVNNPVIIKPLVRNLRSGRPVVVFPEGRRSDGLGVKKSYPVPAIAAMKSGATLLPVSISPTSAKKRFFGFPGFTIRVLPVDRIDSEPLENMRSRRARATLHLRRIMQRVSVAAFTRKPMFEAVLDATMRFGRARTMLEDHNERPSTYGDLLKASLAISRWLRPHTELGENVGVLLPNIIPSVCTVLGLSASGRVPTIFNFTTGGAGVRSAAIAAGVRTVITSEKFLEQARLMPLLDALKHCRILYLEDIRKTLTLSDKLWLFCFAIRFPRLAVRKQSLTDPAVVLFTSGSEDRPKGVVLSHDAVISNVAQVCAVFNFSTEDKIFNPLPLYHAYSFTAGMLLSLVTGTAMFLYVSPLKYRAIPELIYRRNCTVLFGTSTFLHYYAQNADPMDFQLLRYVIAGGEKLSDEVTQMWLDKFGLRIYEGYGSTEASPVISLSATENYRRGAVGRFLPGVECRVVAVEGIQRGGVLHIRGPNLMLGYYRYGRPGVIEAPRSVVGEGWYETGDVVDVGADGIVTILGRVKRFAKIAGEMVSLDVVEQIARSASPAHQHAALSQPHSGGGDMTILFTTDAQLTRAHLLDAARRTGTQELAVARKLVTVPEIPLLSNGKIDYVGLKLLLEDDTYTRLLAVASGQGPQPGADELPDAQSTDQSVSRKD